MGKTSRKIGMTAGVAVLVVLITLIVVIVLQHFVYGGSDPDHSILSQFRRVVEALRS